MKLFSARTEKDHYTVVRLPFDTEALTEATRRQEGPATLSISPYDVPEALLLKLGEEDVVLEWEHLTDGEPLQTLQQDSGQLKIGQRTGRLYELTLPRQCLQTSNPGERIREVLDDMPEAETKLYRPTLKRALAQVEDQLEKALQKPYKNTASPPAR